MIEDFDISQLLAPLNLDKFLQEYWETIPLILSRTQSDYYRDLMTVEDLDRILFYSRPQPPEIRVVKNQQEMLPSRYVDLEGSLNLNQLYKAYKEDHTLVVNNIHQYWQPLAQVCLNLQSWLNHNVVANLYFSPEQSQGLSPHYDTHDVFVLQIAGEKTWQIYRPWQTVPLLGSFQPVIPQEQLDEPMYEVRLKAGDLLYLPRGFIHQARTESSFSLHVTLGIYPAQWLDLIVSALTAFSLHDERFRKALPVGYLDRQESTPEIQTQLQTLLQTLAENPHFESAMDMMRDRLIRETIPVPDGHFSQINNLDRVDLDTVVQKRYHLPCRIIEQFDSVKIQFPGNTIKGKPSLTATLKFVAEASDRFTVKELPGNLTDNGKIVLIQRLIRGGLLKTLSRVGKNH